MSETNCKNCGVVLSNGRYCYYGGAGTARTKHTVVPLADMRVEIELPSYLTDNSEEFEDVIKYELINKAVSEMTKNLVIHKCEDIIKDTTKYVTTIKFGSY